MAVQKGSAFLLKDNSSGTPQTIGGLKRTSMTINGETVMGIRSMTLSASGVFTDSTGENNLRGAAFTGSAVNYDLVFGDGSDVKGAFIVTSYERAGEFNGEETFSCTLESSGTITYTNA